MPEPVKEIQVKNSIRPYSQPVTKEVFKYNDMVVRELIRNGSDDIGKVIHDLKQPSTVILGNIETSKYISEVPKSLEKLLLEIKPFAFNLYLLINKSMSLDHPVKGYDNFTSTEAEENGSYPDNSFSIALHQPLNTDDFNKVINFFYDLRRRDIDPDLNVDEFKSEYLAKVLDFPEGHQMAFLLLEEIGFYSQNIQKIFVDNPDSDQSIISSAPSENEPQSATLARAVSKNINKISSNIEDIRSKLKEKNTGPELEEGSPSLLISGYITDFQHAFDYSHMPYIHFESSSDSIIKFDQRAVRQIFENLLTNAEKYGVDPMDPNNHLPYEVIIKEVDDQIFVSVRDHGIGLSQENQVFFNSNISEGRFANARDSKIEGSGKGLYSAREEGLKSGIKVTVSSPGENQGCTFTIHIPKTPNPSTQP